MSKPRKGNPAQARPVSAVEPGMLAFYRRMASPPTMAEEIRTLWMLDDDFRALLAAGDQMYALGAGLQLVDVALRIAATPATAPKSLQHKVDSFERHFASLVSSFNHDHVARVADAALAMEIALAADDPQVRQ